MEPLTRLILIRILWDMLVIFLLVAILLVVFRIVQNARKARATRNLKRGEALILEFIQTSDGDHLAGLSRSQELRDLIVRMGTNLSGDIQTKLMLAYDHLGFVLDDFRAMARSDSAERVFALERCRSLCVPLPEEAWPLLLRSRTLVCRWATMEYLVLMKGRAAMPWVIHFIYHGANRKKGVILHMLACLARVSPEIIPVLLDHCDDDFYREALVRTLTSYPAPGCESIIARSIGTGSSPELLISGIRALGVHPSPTSRPFLLALIGHENWAVRMMVADSLKAFVEPEVNEALTTLTIDTSFQVRTKAVSSLIALGNRESLEMLAEDPSHPSHGIYKRLTAVRM